MSFDKHPTMSSAKTGAGRDGWQTPGKALDPIIDFAGGQLLLDVATAPDNPTGARHFYTEAQDGLILPWQVGRSSGTAFSNPPYSNSKAWIAKAVLEADQGAEIVMLIASRTGAKYFAPVFRADALCFVQGRLTFNDPDTGEPVRGGKDGRPMPAPFDSAIVYWGARAARFRRKLGHLGEIVMPMRGAR